MNKLTENVAAICASVHQHSRFTDFYNAVRDETVGFPGIWMLCARVGFDFTEAELDGRHVAGETYEWIEAIDGMAEAVIGVGLSGESLSSHSWRDEAVFVIGLNQDYNA